MRLRLFNTKMVENVKEDSTGQREAVPEQMLCGGLFEIVHTDAAC